MPFRLKIDIAGKRFGHLVALEYYDSKSKQSRWKCQCDCGNISIIYRSHLTRGISSSCGCQRVSHGMKGSRLYGIWSQMKARCNNPNHASYSLYGGRGITVCERWMRFDNFISDMLEEYEAHSARYGETNTTIDRIDNSKGYSIDNCRWATPKVQRRNSSQSKYYTYKGKTITAGEISDKYGIKYETIESRLRRGWTIDKVIETPVAPQYGGPKRLRKLKEESI